MAARNARSPARSRPKRGSRGPLSRDEILETGLRIARDEDLRTLTMSRLGDELGVTAMALYRHFESKGELIDGILDHFVREADVTGHGTDASDWQLWLRRTSLSMYRALAETPGVLPFVAERDAWRFGPSAMAVYDATLEILRGAGFRKRDAIEIQANALALTVGWAMLDSSGGGAPSSKPLDRGLQHYLEAVAGLATQAR